MLSELISFYAIALGASFYIGAYVNTKKIQYLITGIFLGFITLSMLPLLLIELLQQYIN